MQVDNNTIRSKGWKPAKTGGMSVPSGVSQEKGQ